MSAAFKEFPQPLTEGAVARAGVAITIIIIEVSKLNTTGDILSIGRAQLFLEGFKAFRVQDEAEATGIVDLGNVALLQF